VPDVGTSVDYELGGQSMPGRAKKTSLEAVGEWVCLPSFLVAGALYALVTCVPDAVLKRDLLIGAFLVAGVGAGLVNFRAAPKGIRVTGVTAMAAGLTAAACVVLW